MSSVKSLVKSAREAIDRGDYGASLRLCEMGLDIEEDHYLLLVLKGIALQNTDSSRAEAPFRRAIALQPGQLLAWQVIPFLEY